MTEAESADGPRVAALAIRLLAKRGILDLDEPAVAFDGSVLMLDDLGLALDVGRLGRELSALPSHRWVSALDRRLDEMLGAAAQISGLELDRWDRIEPRLRLGLRPATDGAPAVVTGQRLALGLLVVTDGGVVVPTPDLICRWGHRPERLLAVAEANGRRAEPKPSISHARWVDGRPLRVMMGDLTTTGHLLAIAPATDPEADPARWLAVATSMTTILATGPLTDHHHVRSARRGLVDLAHRWPTGAEHRLPIEVWSIDSRFGAGAGGLTPLAVLE